MLIKNRAAGVGIATWRGRCLPTDKAACIAELAEDSRKVLMDWEGLNGCASANPGQRHQARRLASTVFTLATRGQGILPFWFSIEVMRLKVFKVPARQPLNEIKAENGKVLRYMNAGEIILSIDAPVLPMIYGQSRTGAEIIRSRSSVGDFYNTDDKVLQNGHPVGFATVLHDRPLLNDRPIGSAVMTAAVPEAIRLVVRAFTSAHMELSTEGCRERDWLV